MFGWPFRRGASVVVYSNCQCSSTFWLFFHVLLAFWSCCSYFMPSKLYVFLSHLVSMAGCGIGLYRFLSVAFSSTLIVCFLLGPSQNVTSVLAMFVFDAPPASPNRHYSCTTYMGCTCIESPIASPHFQHYQKWKHVNPSQCIRELSLNKVLFTWPRWLY